MRNQWFQPDVAQFFEHSQDDALKVIDHPLMLHHQCWGTKPEWSLSLVL
jgi:hypothetical protein